MVESSVVRRESISVREREESVSGMCERSVCSWRVVTYETAGSRWYGAAGLKSESSDADKMYSSNGKELWTVDE